MSYGVLTNQVIELVTIDRAVDRSTQAIDGSKLLVGATQLRHILTAACSLPGAVYDSLENAFLALDPGGLDCLVESKLVRGFRRIRQKFELMRANADPVAQSQRSGDRRLDGCRESDSAATRYERGRARRHARGASS